MQFKKNKQTLDCNCINGDKLVRRPPTKDILHEQKIRGWRKELTSVLEICISHSPESCSDKTSHLCHKIKRRIVEKSFEPAASNDQYYTNV